MAPGGLHNALAQTSLGQVCAAFEWDPNAAAVYTLNHGKGTVYKVSVSDNDLPLDLRIAVERYQYSRLRGFGTISGKLVAGVARLPAIYCPRIAEAGCRSSCEELSASHANGSTSNGRKGGPSNAYSGRECCWIRGTHIFLSLRTSFITCQTSTTRTIVNQLLHDLGYHTREFLLTPKQYGIPNSRLRYYLVARLAPFAAPPSPGVLRCLPGDHSHYSSRTISEYLDAATDPDTVVSDRVLTRWGRLFDIVYPSSTSSCCFTRGKYKASVGLVLINWGSGYSHLVEGSGSILQMAEVLEVGIAATDGPSSYASHADIESV